MSTPGQTTLLAPLTERAFQAQVTEPATLMGWQWLHVRPCRTAHGWTTPTSGTLAEGFVDLVLVRGRRDQRVLFVELKADRGRLTRRQAEIHVLLRAAGLDVRLWRPDDWDAIVEVLR